MAENWIGKAVSIHCRGDIGVFQGVIKQVSPVEIVITKAVRNGIPLRKTNVEVTLTCKDIEKLDLIAGTNLPNLYPSAGGSKQQPQQQQGDDSVTAGLDNLKIAGGGNRQQNGSGQVVRNKTPTGDGRKPQQQQQQQVAAKSPGPNKYSQQQQNSSNNGQRNGYENGSAKSTSRPIEINGGKGGQSFAPYTKNDNQQQQQQQQKKKNPRNGSGPGNVGNGNGFQQQRYNNNHKNSAFGTPVDDPMMDEDFDFEKNLALFDKQAIWDEIDAIQSKPDLLRQTVSSGKKKYRHDENVLASEPTQYRQIELEGGGGVGSLNQEYLTDEGLVIPSIPRSTRNLVQQLAENHGLGADRQNDLLARGAAEIALQLLGGSRRLTPNNQHQWPKIAVVCDEPYNARISEIGIATGRMLACHGLKVVVYVSCSSKSTRVSHELELYAATGNLFTFNVNALPSSDLVIAAIKARRLADPLRKWILENRAPVLAIDPPAGGFEAVPAKCTLLPVLPLTDLGPESATGRLYLANLGIPDKFFADSGIKYKSPFDKAVIPIHRRKN
ncbi:enhancer of mRNA-decapping protein 3 [Culex quinquefasciatus]|uniref:enhancer of mRNA-decapping protein 3 n=1 Tax=Culex quinquefasciatus TaxID=7176 RepID=UPI0018E37239|nr:enhancer of mRNA-decapping protein 3 [Culex quinquefasciatus]XP_038119943.1 enhancer of mRNA-decapping protein 3 [Culex quinquefasciatus]